MPLVPPNPNFVSWQNGGTAVAAWMGKCREKELPAGMTHNQSLIFCTWRNKLTISLYDASVGSYLQIVPAVNALLEKAAGHFSAQGVALDELPDWRLYDDMLPLRFQIASVVHHSMGTVESMRSGVFSPPPYDATMGFAGLQEKLQKAHADLKALLPDEVNALSAKPMEFVMGDLRLPFSTENFVLSFSLPNFYFHAATAYDILRNRGLPLAKRDFLGKLRITREPRA